MHVTIAELTLAAPIISAASALGAIRLGAKNAAQAAEAAVASQRQSEAEQRRQERIAGLYQELFEEVDRIARSVRKEAGVGRLPALGGEDEARRAELRARVSLFASSEVAGLWEEWSNLLSAVWLAGSRSNSSALAASTTDELFERLKVATAALRDQMRDELGS